MGAAPTVPHVAQIRALRERTDRATLAELHLNRLSATLQVIRMVEARVAHQPGFEVDIPGDKITAEVSAAWALPEPAERTLGTRRQHLRRLEEALQPHLVGAQADRAKMQELLEKQRMALTTRAFVSVARALEQLERDWSDARAVLAPLERRSSVLGPLAKALDQGREALDDALEDGGALARWRAAQRVAELVKSVEAVRDSMDLDFPIPTRDPLPEQPDPANTPPAEALREALDAVTRHVRAAHSAATASAATAAEAAEALEQKVRAITG